MHTPVRDKLLAGIGTAIIVALLGYMLILGLKVDIAKRREQVMALLDIRTPPPPPPPRPRPRIEHPKAARAAAAASPPNLRNKAAAIVPPPPVVKLPPPPPPLVLAPKAGTGMAPSAGASDRPGPGQGAGGNGNGTGAGGEGDGDGGGGVAPRPINDRAKFSYLSGEVQAALQADHQWHVVGVRYRVEVDGSASNCAVTKTSGIAGLDRETCAAIDQHFRYHPARDPDGQKAASTIVDTVGWRYDPADETPPGR